jgi:hypothetical protein
MHGALKHWCALHWSANALKHCCNYPPTTTAPEHWSTEALWDGMKKQCSVLKVVVLTEQVEAGRTWKKNNCDKCDSGKVIKNDPPGCIYNSRKT